MALETPAGTPPAGGVERMTANFGLKDRAVGCSWCGGAHARGRRRGRRGRAGPVGASVQRRRPPRWRPLRGRRIDSDSGADTGSDTGGGEEEHEEEDEDEDESSLSVTALRHVGPWLSGLMAAEGITTLGELDAALLQRRSSKAQLAALLSQVCRNARRGEVAALVPPRLDVPSSSDEEDWEEEDEG